MIVSALENVVEHLPSQMEEALRLGRPLARKTQGFSVSQILFCGMGGSALSGDIFRVLAQNTSRIPWQVNRSENLPAWAGPKTLAIFSSYSGNTHEILSVLKQAIKRRVQILAVTSGGDLAGICRSQRLSFVKIPQGLPPRFALGFLTFAPLPFLIKIGALKVSRAEMMEAMAVLGRESRERARKIARRLRGKYAHFYATSGILEPAALRWRTQLAENAKYLSSHLCLPEMFHNEIEGWKFPTRVVRDSVAVFFKDRADSEILLRKWDFAKKVLKKAGAKVLEIESRGSSPLARLFSLIFLGDRVSLELAYLAHVNPYKVPILEALKKIQ